MKIVIRNMGNSQGVIIPKRLLDQAGLENEAEMVVENGCIVLRQRRRNIRAGWAAASQRIAALGDDGLVLPEFGNDVDVELKW